MRTRSFLVAAFLLLTLSVTSATFSQPAERTRRQSEQLYGDLYLECHSMGEAHGMQPDVRSQTIRLVRCARYSRPGAAEQTDLGATFGSRIVYRRLL